MVASGRASPLNWEHWPGVNVKKFPSRLLLLQSSAPERQALQTFVYCVPIWFLESDAA